MTTAERTSTHTGIDGPVWTPATFSARTTTPAVLAASCSPCPKAIAAAETVCAYRNPRETLCGFARRNSQRIAVMTR
jgi:hypothetical protein